MVRLFSPPSRHAAALDVSAGLTRAADQRRSLVLMATTWAGSLVVMALVWLAAESFVRRDEADALARARRDGANLARIIAEQTERTISAADRTLTWLAYDLSRFGLRSPEAQAALEVAAQDRNGQLQLSYADANGDMIQSSVARDVQKINLADREHFRVHREGQVQGLFISRPVFGRISNRWSIQLTRRIELTDGSFGGVMVASLDPFYFARTFDSLDIGRHGAISVISANGVLLARNVMDDHIIGQDVSQSPVLIAARAAPKGFLRAASAIDQVVRLTSFQEVEGYPLQVVAGFAEDEFLAETRARAAAYRYGAAGFSVLLVLVSLLVTLQSRVQERYLRVRDQAARRLAASEAALQGAYDQMEQRVIERTAELSRSLTELRAARDRVQRTERMAAIGTLAGGIAHEINTPSQFIGDNLSFIRQGVTRLAPADDPGQQLLAQELAAAAQEALDGVERVRTIVRTVRQFAHPATGQISLQPAARLVDAAVSLARASWKPVAELEVVLEPGLPDVPCQGNDVDHVLLALIINAAEAIESRRPPGGGRITLSVRRVGAEIEFSVADNGCGVPAAARAHIWDLFFTTKPVGKGTGQSLALCHSAIVVNHGGRIDFESTPGEGSRFFFTLPLALPEVDAPGAASRQPPTLQPPALQPEVTPS